MACSYSVMSQIIEEGMAHYWRVIAAPSDEGLAPYEIEWRRDDARAMDRFDKKFGREIDETLARGLR
jgi:hypothetical protein